MSVVAKGFKMNRSGEDETCPNQFDSILTYVESVSVPDLRHELGIPPGKQVDRRVFLQGTEPVPGPAKSAHSVA